MIQNSFSKDSNKVMGAANCLLLAIFRIKVISVASIQTELDQLLRPSLNYCAANECNGFDQMSLVLQLYNVIYISFKRCVFPSIAQRGRDSSVGRAVVS